MDNCIFCKIVRGELPSRKVYEDDEVVAFHDIHPAAPLHVLVVPKVHVANLSGCTDEHSPVLGKIMALAPRLARENGSPDGFRLIVNDGRIGRQDVMHLHVHVLGGSRPLGRMIEPQH
jgi:histidine triad (HIT) family protein